MWQVVALYLLVLLSSSLADGQSTCDSDGPDNCTFLGGLKSCNWTFDLNAWTIDRNRAVFGTASQQGLNMTSKTACSTRGNSHCLKIRYKFEKQNITELNVYIIDEDGGEKLIWDSEDRRPYTSAPQTANISICSNEYFQIRLKATKYQPNYGRLFLYYITYINSSCSTEQTSGAQSSTSTDSCTNKRTTTSLQTFNTSTDQTVSTTEGRISTTGSHVSTDASAGISKAGSNDVSVVVGVVVTVIVIAVAVAIFMLYRRKRLHMWKTCFRNGNKKTTAATGTAQNRERSVGREYERAVNPTPIVSGYENHAFTYSGPQSSDSYYNVIQGADGAGDSAAPQYSNVHESQAAELKQLPNGSKFADDDPYEIKAEHRNLPSKSAATKNANPNTNLKGKTGRYENYLAPTSNRDKSQPTSDYSLARAEGGETNGVYDYSEEDPRNPRGGETALYQYAKDPDVNGEGHADATGVYHILERDSSGSQPVSAYHVPKGGNVGQQHTPTVKVSKGQTGNYNTLDFAGDSSGQKNDGDDSGGVYNHLNAGSDDPYNVVDREKRAEVIDDEYSHIK